jgi:hypothetical protein
VGLVFLLVGILGFIPGVTTHYSDLAFAGHDSSAKLLGVFQTSVLAVWLIGVIGGLEWLPVNAADNWLHIVLGVGMIALGFVTGRSVERTAPAV